MEKELRLRRIPFIAQQELKLSDKGEPFERTYQPDLICYDLILLELKAVKEICDEYRAQLYN